MLLLNSPKTEDKEWVDDILKKALEKRRFFSCDDAFATNYLWQKKYNIKIGRYKNFIIKSYKGDKNTEEFAFPMGTGDVKDAVNEIVQYAFERGKSIRFVTLVKEETEMLSDIFNGRISFEADRNSAEYIYLSKDLADLPGRKYHSKRNHISKFNKLYNYSYEEITDKNAEQALEVAEMWCSDNIMGKGKGLSGEACVIKCAFDNYEKLNLYGGLIRIDGQAVAMTLGEEINKDVFVVHFEKALGGYNGLYAAINQMFSKSLTGYKYINREEDMGIEGLRKAKLSYKPCMLLEKYSSTPISRL
ncbi:MAG: DUF2156 domain-containing protein [Acutalibacteraceae bacterium]